MGRKLFVTFLAASLFAVTFAARPAAAQFEKGRSYLGARIGIGAIGSAFSFGADYEYGLTNLGEVGPGRIGIGGIVDYSNWSDGLISYSWIPIGVMGYYHLDLDNNKLDPFAGIGLGYEIFNASWKGAYGYSWSAGYNSGIFVAGDVGIRYFFQPNLALQARLGFGSSLVSAGIDYKF